MAYFTPAQLGSLEATATVAAEYIDLCDSGTQSVRLDAMHYRTCGELLAKIFNMLDARQAFPTLLQQSDAAREIAGSIEIGRQITISRLVFYPELAALLNRVSQ